MTDRKQDAWQTEAQKPGTLILDDLTYRARNRVGERFWVEKVGR